MELSASPRSEASSSRNGRARGERLVVSTADRDLDGGDLGFMIHPRGTISAHPSFHQQFEINRARGVAVKAIFVRMMQVVQSKMVAAPLVGTVEKRTMWSRGLHGLPADCGSFVFIGRIR